MDKESVEKLIADKPPEENGVTETLPHLAAVIDWLQGNGWKASKTSVHRHHRAGKLRPDAGGAYQVRAVERYAKDWLKRRETGKRLHEDADELQRRKIQLEIKNLEIEQERKRFAHERDLGRWIPADEFALALAGRAAVLDAGTKRMFQVCAPEWVRSVDGDRQKVPELVLRMLADWDEHMNTYGAPREYTVELAAEEETEETEEVS